MDLSKKRGQVLYSLSQRTLSFTIFLFSRTYATEVSKKVQPKKCVMIELCTVPTEKNVHVSY